MPSSLVPRSELVRRAALAFVEVLALAMPGFVGILSSPPVHAQPPQQVQSGAVATPKFEVASIKPCDPTSALFLRGGGPPTLTPRSLTVNCQRLSGIIFTAYLIYAEGHRKVVPPLPIEGAPAWLDQDRYMIEAKSESDASSEMMQGPMLRSTESTPYRDHASPTGMYASALGGVLDERRFR
jgi:hypothetical protein